MRASVASSADLWSADFRLDGSYHTSEGVQAAQILQKWAGSSRKIDPLGSIAYLFNGPRFPRIYVEDPENGIPFLSSSDMLMADLSSIKYLSKKHTPASLLKEIKIERGWTLISCSGTIGNTVYVRQDMADMTGSQHIMRAAPREGKVLSGYLFAFLSSQLAYSLLTQGTYGAVIQHIEPKHIENLPIPRLEPAQEERIHQLIEQAAELRTEAIKLLYQAQHRFYREVMGIDPSNLMFNCRHDHAFCVDKSTLNSLRNRLDAFHYVGYVREAEKLVTKPITIGDLATAYEPTLFKRPYTGSGGVPFLSGIDLYNYNPRPHMYISVKMPKLDNYRVKKGTLLIQSDGSRYGLIGTPTYLPKHLDQAAVSEHLIRIYPLDSKNRGYIFIFLSTDIGRRLLLKHSFGSVMGNLFGHSIEETSIPNCLDVSLRHSFEHDFQSICHMRELANDREDQAQTLLRSHLELTDNPAVIQ